MKIIEIETLENGSHRNQTGEFKKIPEGWAVIPDDMETPIFPFGEIETKDEDIIEVETVINEETDDVEKVEKVIGTRKVVTKWTAGEMPEPNPTLEAISQEERIEALENALLELALGGVE